MRTGLVALVCHQSDVHNANSPCAVGNFIGPIFLSFPRRASRVLRREPVAGRVPNGGLVLSLDIRANVCAAGRRCFLPEWSGYLDRYRIQHLWEYEACDYKFKTLVSLSHS
jgi:hypothetical protein